MCLGAGDRYSGAVDASLAARAVREALRRGECENAKFSLAAGDSGDWDDEFLKLRGPGSKWEDPMFSSDYGVIPFIPRSWGGVGAQAGDPAAGANVSVSTGVGTGMGTGTGAGASNANASTSTPSGTTVDVTVFSGARELNGSSPAELSLFQFDVACTPSKRSRAPS